jgi:hypothetical protein
MFSRLRWHVNRKWFDLNIKTVLNTPPVKCDYHSSVVFVSQLRHRDLFMYLLAIKSLARFITPRRLFVLDDTSLTSKDKSILYEHAEQIEIIPITEVQSEKCPKGIFWERLIFISDIISSCYAIQLDSDTLTLKNPDEVVEFIKDEKTFTLGGGWNKLQTEIFPMEETCIARKQQFRGINIDHVQPLSEANFDKLQDYKALKYVRGCAAFVGFAKHAFSRETVESISASLCEIVGPDKWREWGSDQVTSNIIVANTPGAAVLPFPKYCSQHPSIEVNASSFIHFIGAYRFIKGDYTALSKKVINELLSPC